MRLLLPLLFLSCSDAIEKPDPTTYQSNTMGDTMGEVFEDEEEAEGRNRRPKVIKPRIRPAEVFTMTDIALDFATEDPDGSIVKTKIQWYINDQKKMGKVARRLSNSYYRKGDRIFAEITARDDLHEVVVQTPEITVANSPPTPITKGSISKVDGFVFKVEDPDDDEISFRIEGKVPTGMWIDAKKGVLHYDGSENTSESGLFEANIIAADPDGAQVVFPLKFTVSPGQTTDQPAEK